MNSLPKYIDVSKLRYVEDTYTVAFDAQSFTIPLVNADRRIVNLNIEEAPNQSELNITIPDRVCLGQELILNLLKTGELPIRSIEIRRSVGAQSFAFVSLATFNESPDSITILFKSDKNGRFQVDFDASPSLQRMSQVNSLTVSGVSIDPGFNATYNRSTRLFNNRPFFATTGYVIEYHFTDGWIIRDSDSLNEIYAVSNGDATYPWEVDYASPIKVVPTDLINLLGNSSAFDQDLNTTNSPTFAGLTLKDANQNTFLLTPYEEDGEPKVDLAFNGQNYQTLSANDPLVVQSSLGTAAQSDSTDFAPAIHDHTISQVTGLQNALDGKQASGTYATLVNGTVPSTQLPSYVDDVLEFADLAAIQATTGETGKIYVAIDTRKTYRWSGTTYVEISPSEVTSVNGLTGAVTLSIPTAADTSPSALGATAVGISTNYARADHVHPMPTAGDVGAYTAVPTTGILDLDSTSTNAPVTRNGRYTITWGTNGGSNRNLILLGADAGVKVGDILRIYTNIPPNHILDIKYIGPSGNINLVSLQSGFNTIFFTAIAESGGYVEWEAINKTLGLAEVDHTHSNVTSSKSGFITPSSQTALDLLKKQHDPSEITTTFIQLNAVSPDPFEVFITNKNLEFIDSGNLGTVVVNIILCKLAATQIGDLFNFKIPTLNGTSVSLGIQGAEINQNGQTINIYNIAQITVTEAAAYTAIFNGDRFIWLPNWHPSSVSTTKAGLMSPGDKTKLDGIASGAEVNVQADWTQTDNAQDDFIKNKPTTFTPSAHSHSISEVTNLSTVLDEKIPLNIEKESLTVSSGIQALSPARRKIYEITVPNNVSNSIAFLPNLVNGAKIGDNFIVRGTLGINGTFAVQAQNAVGGSGTITLASFTNFNPVSAPFTSSFIATEVRNNLLRWERLGEILDAAPFNHTHTAADIGLGNVNNTSDLNKPISTATQAALDTKGPGRVIVNYNVTATQTELGLSESYGKYWVINIYSPASTIPLDVQLNALFPTNGTAEGSIFVFKLHGAVQNGSTHSRRPINILRNLSFGFSTIITDPGYGPVGGNEAITANYVLKVGENGGFLINPDTNDRTPTTHTHEVSALSSTGAGEGDLPVALGDGTISWQNGTTWAGQNITAADIGAATVNHVHSTTDITNFSTAAAAAAPVQSVNNQIGAVSIDAIGIGALPENPELINIVGPNSQTAQITLGTDFYGQGEDIGYITHSSSTNPNISIFSGGTSIAGTLSVNGTSVSLSGHSHSNATTSASGFMSSTDKIKLDGIASGAEVNVQANWTQTDNAQDDFIKNKPTAFTPSSHTHGNITNAGAIGSTASLPIITTTGGVLTTGSFGATAGSFAEGNHIHSNASITTPGFMSASDKIKTDALFYTLRDRSVYYRHFAIYENSGFNGFGNSATDLNSLTESQLNSNGFYRIENTGGMFEWDPVQYRGATNFNINVWVELGGVTNDGLRLHFRRQNIVTGALYFFTGNLGYLRATTANANSIVSASGGGNVTNVWGAANENARERVVCFAAAYNGGNGGFINNIIFRIDTA